MAPDLPYVLPRATSAEWGWYSDYTLTYTHDFLTGMLAGTVAAVLLVALFHHLLKRPLIALLPPAATSRLTATAEQFRWSGARRVAWIVVSATIGVATHLAWDALVHENGSASWSFLPDTPTVTGGLWWASTLVGALALAVWLYRWWRRTPPGQPASLPPAVRWSALAALAVAALTGAAVPLLNQDVPPLEALRSVAALREAVSGAMSGAAAALLVYAAAWQLWPQSTKTPAA